MTQGRRLISILKRREMTYMQMLLLGYSVCPWKRIAESLRHGETLVKRTNGKGRIAWRVVSS